MRITRRVLKEKNKEKFRNSLCATCKRAGLRKFENNETDIYCHSFEDMVKGIVVECTEHEISGAMDLYFMKEIAWLVEMEGRKVIGFKPPKKREEE